MELDEKWVLPHQSSKVKDSSFENNILAPTLQSKEYASHNLNVATVNTSTVPTVSESPSQIAPTPLENHGQQTSTTSHVILTDEIDSSGSSSSQIDHSSAANSSTLTSPAASKNTPTPIIPPAASTTTQLPENTPFYLDMFDLERS